MFFFSDADRRAYLALVATACTVQDVACLAWCPMGNRVHPILAPNAEDGLRAALG